MKKLIFVSIMILTISIKMNSQVPVTLDPRLGNNSALKDLGNQWIDIYSSPDYLGTKHRITALSGDLTLPFNSRNISYKVKPGLIVYVKPCGTEFGDEIILYGDKSRYPLPKLCGVRFAVSEIVTVKLCGFSTEIHNNDCKRFFGTVKVKIIENKVDGLPVLCPPSLSSAVAIRNNFEALMYSNPNANSSSPINRFIYNNNPIPEIIDGANIFAAFVVSREALQSGRISVSTEVDLGSAHKSCDLCDDFSSNVRMARPETYTSRINELPNFSTNSVSKQLIVGPYRATGNRDGFAVTASGGIFHNIRAHFRVQ
jgi:hypothetical protein